MNIQNLKNHTIYYFSGENRICLGGSNTEMLGPQDRGIRTHSGFYARFKVALGLAEKVTVNRITYTVNKNSFAKWAKGNQSLPIVLTSNMIEIKPAGFMVNKPDQGSLKANQTMEDIDASICDFQMRLDGAVIEETDMGSFLGSLKEAEEKRLAKLQIVPFRDRYTILVNTFKAMQAARNSEVKRAFKPPLCSPVIKGRYPSHLSAQPISKSIDINAFFPKEKVRFDFKKPVRLLVKAVNITEIEDYDPADQAPTIEKKEQDIQNLFRERKAPHQARRLASLQIIAYSPAQELEHSPKEQAAASRPRDLSAILKESKMATVTKKPLESQVKPVTPVVSYSRIVAQVALLAVFVLSAYNTYKLFQKEG